MGLEDFLFQICARSITHVVLASVCSRRKSLTTILVPIALPSPVLFIYNCCFRLARYYIQISYLTKRTRHEVMNK